MSQPTFSELMARRSKIDYASSTTGAAICLACGALVDQRWIKKHSEFHENLEERFKSLEDLLRVEHS